MWSYKMTTRIETTAEKWQSEIIAMTEQEFYLVTRDNKIYWENEN